MSLNPAALAQIKAYTQSLIEKAQPATEFVFGLNIESVEWLDTLINNSREEYTGTARDLFVSIYGSFLGEAVIQAYGGTWTDSNGRLGVVFDSGVTCFPFSKVKKQFENGGEDSILSFYRIIGDPELHKPKSG